MFFNDEWLNKLHGIPFSNKKEQTIGTCNNLEGCKENDAD